MNQNTANKMEFNEILNQLAEYASTEKAKERLFALKPFLEERQCRQKLEETTEAVKVLETFGTPPLSSMKDLNKILELAEKGAMLIPAQLTAVAGFVSSCRRMKGYLKKAELANIAFGSYGNVFVELDALYEQIDDSIRYDAVSDTASPPLRDIRRKIEQTKTGIKTKLETILRSKKEWFSDGFIATRNGRLVLPVKREYKHMVPGSVIDLSSGGATCFIEPTSVGKLRESLSILEIEEENEIRKILYTLTGMVDEAIPDLRINADCMETLDFAFSKARLSLSMKGVPPILTTERKIRIIEGRHPLLPRENCVPLEFEIGDGVRGVVITGPNTGGKTVALKTVGLLSMMAQSGLHVPAGEGSIFCMHNAVLCDIGDGQSISENLSTFSSHITNIIGILGDTTGESLVLLDELGSGTDPAEGMGIAIAVLKELKNRGCLFVATTHYPEVKEYAETAEGLLNARMTFDRESLKPLYRLQIGEAGESCALYIAKRLGFPNHLLVHAQREAYGRTTDRRLPERLLELEEEQEQMTSIAVPTIKKEVAVEETTRRSDKFNVGDSVTVYPQKEVGIIYRRANEKGELGVQVKGKKRMVNHKRVKLICPASELYPDDYDFSIIFDSVANRKARHNMEKKHTAGLTITYEQGETR